MRRGVFERFLRAEVFLFFATFPSRSLVWAELELVRDGTLEYEVVLLRSLPKVSRFAANALQNYIQLMTRAHLHIFRSLSGSSVFNGTTLAKGGGLLLGQGWSYTPHMRCRRAGVTWS